MSNPFCQWNVQSKDRSCCKVHVGACVVRKQLPTLQGIDVVISVLCDVKVLCFTNIKYLSSTILIKYNYYTYGKLNCPTLHTVLQDGIGYPCIVLLHNVYFKCETVEHIEQDND